MNRGNPEFERDQREGERTRRKKQKDLARLNKRIARERRIRNNQASFATHLDSKQNDVGIDGALSFFGRLIGFATVTYGTIYLYAQLNRNNGINGTIFANENNQSPQANAVILPTIVPPDIAPKSIYSAVLGRHISPYEFSSMSQEEAAKLIPFLTPYVSESRIWTEKLVYPPTIEAWDRLIRLAIAEYNLINRLDPNNDLAPRVDEIKQLMAQESCGGGLNSNKGALWPLHVMPNYHPYVAQDPQNRWWNVQKGVSYYAEGLRQAYDLGYRGSDIALEAAAGYHGGYGAIGKSWNKRTESNKAYYSFFYNFIRDGQKNVNLRFDTGLCALANTQPGFPAWQQKLQTPIPQEWTVYSHP